MPSKQLRKIHVNGRDFLWSYPSPYFKMSLLTPDKKFVASYEPEIIREPPMWSFSGKGLIIVHRTEIPEFLHIKEEVILDTPDWSDLWVATPQMARRVIVFIFDRLLAEPD